MNFENIWFYISLLLSSGIFTFWVSSSFNQTNDSTLKFLFYSDYIQVSVLAINNYIGPKKDMFMM